MPNYTYSHLCHHHKFGSYSLQQRVISVANYIKAIFLTHIKYIGMNWLSVMFFLIGPNMEMQLYLQSNNAYCYCYEYSQL